MNNKLDLEIAILGFLIESPKHGYEVFKSISNLSGIGFIWKVKMSNLYVMIKKLEEAGLMTSRLGKEGSRPQRKILYISKQGESIFREWIQKPVSHGRDFRIKFLLKIYFLLQMDKKACIALINNQEKECLRWNENLKMQQTEGNDVFMTIVKEYRVSQISNLLKWLDKCKQLIKE